MGEMHDAGRRTGMTMSGIGLGAVAGPPISGALAQTPGGFKVVGYYAGTIPGPLVVLDLLLKLSLLLSLLQVRASLELSYSYTSRNT